MYVALKPRPGMVVLGKAAYLQVFHLLHGVVPYQF